MPVSGRYHDFLAEKNTYHERYRVTLESRELDISAGGGFKLDPMRHSKTLQQFEIMKLSCFCEELGGKVTKENKKYVFLPLTPTCQPNSASKSTTVTVSI